MIRLYVSVLSRSIYTNIFQICMFIFLVYRQACYEVSDRLALIENT